MEALLFPDFKNIQGKEVLPLSEGFSMIYVFVFFM